MSRHCPICNKRGEGVRRDVRGGVPIKVLSCDECFLHFLEIWDDEKRVYNFYNNNNYVFKPNVTCEGIKYDEYGERAKWATGKKILDILNNVDNIYRTFLKKEKIGDLITCRAWI